MVRIVTKYQTSDGELFDSQEAAEQYEFALELEKVFDDEFYHHESNSAFAVKNILAKYNITRKE